MGVLMKTVFLVIISLFMILNPKVSFADSLDQKCCKEIYLQKIEEKQRQKEKYYKGSVVALLGSVGIAVGLSLAWAAGAPVFIGALLATGSIGITGFNEEIAEEIPNTTSKESRALGLIDSEVLKGFSLYSYKKKLFRQVRKSIPHADEVQILQVIDEGFESGDFCKQKKTINRKQIANYVIENY